MFKQLLTLGMFATAAIPVFASPILTLSVDSIAIIGSGNTAYIASGVTKSFVTWPYFSSINPAAQAQVANGSLFQGNGPAQRVFVYQLYNPGLLATANSTFSLDSEYIQETISGTWTLSETAMVTRDISLESIRTYAAAYGIGYSATADATVDSLFNVDQFTNRELTGAFGKTVTASASGFSDAVKGGNTTAGPDSETKLVQAGSYKFNLTFFVAADSNGLADATASLGNAGFDLVVASPEPSAVFSVAAGVFLIALGKLELRRSRTNPTSGPGTPIP